MTRLKICGLKELSHLFAASDAGADFLGFVFVPGVRRQLDIEWAKDVIKNYRQSRGLGGPELVGLFADQSVEDVNYIIDHCRLDKAQLCGDEPVEYWSEIHKPIIKQLKVNDNGDRDDVIERLLHQVEEVVSKGHICILDKYKEGSQGGTGLTFDWSIATEIADRFSFIIAGGLNIKNVSKAIATVKPWGVDVSSGVEKNYVKDINKIWDFAKQVKD